MKKWLALTVFLLLPAIGQADTPASAQKFAAVLQNPGHRRLVLQSAQATPAWTHLGCAAATFTPAQQIAVYVPIVFDKNGEPTSGVWREAVNASGCGAPVILNVLTQITAPATLATGYLLPGSTIADPILQNAGQASAVKAAGGIPAGCKDGFIADTKFTGYEGPNPGPQGGPPNLGPQSGPWKELWTLRLCGPPRQVVMHFAMDSTGVTIDAVPAAPQ